MMQQEKITLHVLMGVPRSGIPGGPQGHLPHLVHGLRQRGIKVHEEVYGNPEGTPSFRERIEFVLDTAARFKEAMRREHFDIVHFNTAFDLRALLRDALVVTLMGKRQARVVLKFHGTDARLIGTGNLFLRRLIHYLFRKIDMAGVLSDEERRNFLYAGFPKGKLAVVKNILVPEAYRADSEFRVREDIEPGVPLLLFSARLLPEKGLMDVIHALPLVRARGHKVLLLCCGDGPQRNEASRQVEHLGIASQVRMYGHVPESRMKEFYANADMLVFPTYHQEGFPMAVFQSVAAGLPVITTRIRAAADYLREPDNCLWTEPRNPQMLADKIVKLLEDPDLRASMREANFKVGASFNEERIAGEFIDMYRRLLYAGT